MRLPGLCLATCHLQTCPLPARRLETCHLVDRRLQRCRPGTFRSPACHSMAAHCRQPMRLLLHGCRMTRAARPRRSSTDRDGWILARWILYRRISSPRILHRRISPRGHRHAPDRRACRTAPPRPTDSNDPGWHFHPGWTAAPMPETANPTRRPIRSRPTVLPAHWLAEGALPAACRRPAFQHRC